MHVMSSRYSPSCAVHRAVASRVPTRACSNRSHVTPSVTVAKGEYELTMTAAARDAVNDFASHCEGKGPAWRPEHAGPTVRLEWREAKGMSVAAAKD